MVLVRNLLLALIAGIWMVIRPPTSFNPLNPDPDFISGLFVILFPALASCGYYAWVAKSASSVVPNL